RDVVKEEMVICLVQLAQVVIVWLKGDRIGVHSTAVHSTEQNIGRGLQIDDEIRRRDVAGEQLVEVLIDEQLVIVEVEVGEDLVLVEDVIADRRLAEKIRLPERRLLPMAIQQIEELRLQRRAGTVRV